MGVTIFFKVLGPQGSACNGGKMFWSLPTGDQPGSWHSVNPNSVKACKGGFHLTVDTSEWGGGDPNKTVWIAEGSGETDSDGDKTAFENARLLKEATFLTVSELLGANLGILSKRQPSNEVMSAKSGSGYGSGNGYAPGYGSGYGYGYGYGDGYAPGYAPGYGYGYGYGYGDGYAPGYAPGYGDGYGDGSGSGSGYGYGYGSGSGYPSFR